MNHNSFNIIAYLSNMGLRYTTYRIFYELRRKTGLLKKKYPTNPRAIHYPSFSEWKASAQPFFFPSRESLSLMKKPNTALKEAVDNILSGKIHFFGHQYFDLGADYDWVTNPDSGFRYDIQKHWTEVNDYSKEAGDIKYVWEKSRFSFLSTIVRYDYHFKEDHSLFVFRQIMDWIEKNPINQGPNYKCSQEISLRIMNWVFALYFYRNSIALTEETFSKILHSIYWQLRHVYSNINFSRITVRNNHAITETLMLYLGGLLFPFFPESKKWKTKGKKWFEQEIAYQIYEDGTYLQFSMNYHRVVVQLLTWAIRLSDIHKEKFSGIVYERAYKSLNFLYQCQEDSNGQLPNYGSNDGALFFKLSDADFRDYRPQLDALHQILCGQSLYKKSCEDTSWYLTNNSDNDRTLYPPLKKVFGIIKFPVGGFYLIREPETFTFIRCGKHKDRPAQADNLHIDIWYKGINTCPDGGSYLYNTDNSLLKYFMGTESHNTVMLGDHDQMLKGPRFVWYKWSQAMDADLNENEDTFIFNGKISCFNYIDPHIIQERTIVKYKDVPMWIVTDIIEQKPKNIFLKQLWHYFEKYPITIETENDVAVIESDSWYSGYYGCKTGNRQIICETLGNTITTKIAI